VTGRARGSLAIIGPPELVATVSGASVLEREALGRYLSMSHHDGDDVPPVALDVGHEVEARGAGVAGLDPVDAAHRPEQPVVVAVGGTAIGEAAGAEILVVGRETVLQGAP
jgi:hypothetical protein